MKSPFKKLSPIHRPPRNVKVVLVGVPNHEYGVRHNPRAGYVRLHEIWEHLRMEYAVDLGFPLPPSCSFDIRPWRSWGLFVCPYEGGSSIEDFTRFRYLSVEYDHLVFIFIGSNTERLWKYVDHKKHLVLTFANPSRTRFPTTYEPLPTLKGSNLYTRIAEHLHVSKSIWKLPVKVPSKKTRRTRRI